MNTLMPDIPIQAYLQGYLQKEASPRLRKWLNQFSDEERMGRLDEFRDSKVIGDVAERERMLSSHNAPGRGAGSRAVQWVRDGKALTKPTRSGQVVDINDYLVGLHAEQVTKAIRRVGWGSADDLPSTGDGAPRAVADAGIIYRKRLADTNIPRSDHARKAVLAPRIAEVFDRATRSSGQDEPRHFDSRVAIDKGGTIGKVDDIINDRLRFALADAPRATITRKKASGKDKHLVADYPSNKAYNALLDIEADFPTYATKAVRGAGFKDVTDPARLREILRTGYENSYNILNVPKLLQERSVEVAPGVFDVRGLDLAGITGNCMGNVCTSKLSAADVFTSGHRIALVAGDGKTPLGTETLQALLGKDTGPEALDRLNKVLAAKGVPPKSTYEAAMRAIRSSDAVGLIHIDSAGKLKDAVAKHNQNIPPDLFRRGVVAMGLPEDTAMFYHRGARDVRPVPAPRKIQDLEKAGYIRILKDKPTFREVLKHAEKNWDGYSSLNINPNIQSTQPSLKRRLSDKHSTKVFNRAIDVLGLRKDLLRAAADHGAIDYQKYDDVVWDVRERIEAARLAKDPRLNPKSGVIRNPKKHSAPINKVINRVISLARRKARAAGRF
jgi:hypothetical protein